MSQADGTEAWYGHCPCCKRPLALSRSVPRGPREPLPAARGRFAYVINLWGKSSEYVLGALVLGHSIKRSGSKHALVCLYADDVPPSCVLLLSRIWDCRPVQHIAVAADKLGNSSPGHRFAKVFTKLRSLELVEFEKILVLDIDIYVRGNVDDLFQLQAPAAMRRGIHGWKALKTGDSLDGRDFFMGSDYSGWSWGQGTGINAGVMLLQPDLDVFHEMLGELSDPHHPEHCVGNGPEQDYLSRFWADAPWRHIGVEYNFQIHQMFLALHPDRVASAHRIRLLEEQSQIKIVHFSGDDRAKPWRRILDESLSGYWPDRAKDEAFLSLFFQEFQGYLLWVKRDLEWLKSAKEDPHRGWEYADLQISDGHMYRQPADGDASAVCVSLSPEVEKAVDGFVRTVLNEWFEALGELEADLGLNLQQELPRCLKAAELAEGAEGQPAAEPPITFARDSLFTWKRDAGWWTEDWPAEPCFKATVLCSAADAAIFVTFLEDGVATLCACPENASGVFAKVAGEDRVEAEAAVVAAWAETLAPGTPLMLAVFGSDAGLLQALAPLGLPPPRGPCRAFAAVGQAKSSWVTHASWDAAYVSVPLRRT